MSDQFKNTPHIVILKSRTELKMVEFTGEDCELRAHEFAAQCMGDDFPGCITVAARVKQLFPLKYDSLMA